MGTNTEKDKPYELDEMVFDGAMDRNRLLVTLEKKYKEYESQKENHD